MSRVSGILCRLRELDLLDRFIRSRLEILGPGDIYIVSTVIAKIDGASFAHAKIGEPYRDLLNELTESVLPAQSLSFCPLDQRSVELSQHSLSQIALVRNLFRPY